MPSNNDPSFKQSVKNVAQTNPSGKQSLKDVAQKNPSQLGDPVSLKAETSNTEPTPNDRGAGKKDGKTLKEKAEEKLKHNPSALGDPVSLKAETSDSEPTPDDRGALGTSKTKPKL